MSTPSATLTDLLTSVETTVAQYDNDNAQLDTAKAKVVALTNTVSTDAQTVYAAIDAAMSALTAKRSAVVDPAAPLPPPR